ncbi:DUF4082 domain-containing protein [Fibrella sp. WM1]|uniref:DUF4082 domain-containing protein n=1 Tax=Fibrella musci TaxID=3242485 RepID=UPI0035212A84
MNVFCIGLICLLSIVGLNACKKSDATKPAENAITSFITSETTVQATTRSSGPWELGIVFSASVAGKITQLGAKMPEPGTYRVIIWDFDSKQLLRQKTVEQTSPDKLTLEGIDALALTANKKYVISVNSQSAGTNKKYGVISKTNSTEFMPFTKGSILVYNSCYSAVATATFPNSVANVKTEFYGFPECTFIPD